jgi:carboxyl-terminal processing protease
MRRFALLAAGACAGALAAGGIAQFGAPATAAAPDTYRQLNLFGDVFERIRADYVEEPDDAKLVEAAVNGMLSSLDPHSSFLNAKDYQDMQVQTRGEFFGLGIEVTMENELIKVISPIDDTPAAKAGVLAGDIITQLDGEQVRGLTLREAVEKMRGPANSSITLTIIREGVEEPVKVTVVRDVIRVQSVKHRVEGDIGYLRVASFSEQTMEGLEKAIDQIKKEIPADKLRGFVLDLRGNPGGLLDQAVLVSDAFLDRGEIVSTRGRHAEEVQRFTARAGDLVDGKPVIVLLNGGAASASEIVAGALQDHRRATVLGTRSFGKGSVQTIIPIGRNGAIRLTTARYYTPSGRSIQAKGIEPDIEVLPDVPEDMKNLASMSEAELRGHLLGEGEKDAAAPPAVPAAPAGAAAVPPADPAKPAEGAADPVDGAAVPAEATGTDAEGEEEPTGALSSYVPEDPKLDKQLNYAYDLLRGIQVNARFPATAEQGIPN